MLLGFNDWSVLLQPFSSLKSEFIVFVETIKDSVTGSLLMLSYRSMDIYFTLLSSLRLRV